MDGLPPDGKARDDQTVPGDREGIIACLKDLYRRLQGYTFWLYVNRARRYKGEEVDLFVPTHMRLSLRYLSSY